MADTRRSSQENGLNQAEGHLSCRSDWLSQKIISSKPRTRVRLDAVVTDIQKRLGPAGLSRRGGKDVMTCRRGLRSGNQHYGHQAFGKARIFSYLAVMSSSGRK